MFLKYYWSVQSHIIVCYKIFEILRALWLVGYSVYIRRQRHAQPKSSKIFYKKNIKRPLVSINCDINTGSYRALEKSKKHSAMPRVSPRLLSLALQLPACLYHKHCSILNWRMPITNWSFLTPEITVSFCGKATNQKAPVQSNTHLSPVVQSQWSIHNFITNPAHKCPSIGVFYSYATSTDNLIKKMLLTLAGQCGYPCILPQIRSPGL